jgi:hypothetical protein
VTVLSVLDATGQRRSPATCPAIMPAGRRATKASATQPTHRREAGAAEAMDADLACVGPYEREAAVDLHAVGDRGLVGVAVEHELEAGAVGSAAGGDHIRLPGHAGYHQLVAGRRIPELDETERVADPFRARPDRRRGDQRGGGEQRDGDAQLPAVRPPPAPGWGEFSAWRVALARRWPGVGRGWLAGRLGRGRGRGVARRPSRRGRYRMGQRVPPGRRVGRVRSPGLLLQSAHARAPALCRVAPTVPVLMSIASAIVA